MGDQFGKGETLLGIADGRREDLRHGQLAKALVQFEPAVDAAGHGDGQWSVGGNLLEPALAEVLQSQATRRAPAAIESVQLLGLGVPDDGEKITADTIAGGFHQAQGGVGGDGRIDGVAALPQDLQSDLRGEGLAGGRHGVAGDDLRAGRKGLAGNPVGGGGVHDQSPP